MILNRNSPKTKDTNIISVIIIGLVTVLLFFTFYVGKIEGRKSVKTTTNENIETLYNHNKSLLSIIEELHTQVEKRDALIEKLFKVLDQ